MFSSLKSSMWRLLRSLFGGAAPPADPPFDPYAGVRVPREGRPGDRSSAVALAEPRDPDDVRADRR
jgi:hypothetical protein